MTKVVHAALARWLEIGQERQRYLLVLVRSWQATTARQTTVHRSDYSAIINHGRPNKARISELAYLKIQLRRKI
jgi:hypothetical protein